jgi:hypothetical protein
MKILLRLLLFCTVVTSRSFAQRIDSTLATYANQFPQERMYLQYDKPLYSPGETIWFKAYLMSGIMPSDISKNGYADFFDAEGRLLAHSVFPIVEGSFHGQFDIPDSLSTPYVHVKAYTAWMLNFDSAFLYQKNIRILQKTPKTITKITYTPSVEFFPEGGDAVVGIPSKIAFKATDQLGKPVKIRGFVLNNSNAVVDTIRTQHDGMGFIRLTPKAGETYTVKWYDEQNAVHQTPLPVAKASGATIELSAGSNRKNFVIRRSENAPDNLKQLHIVGTVNQQLVYMANVNLQTAPFIGGGIPTLELPTGILQVTIFDDAWTPLAERICFINNNEAIFEPEVGFKVLGLGKRGKNTLQIDLPDTMAANLSVAITDKAIGVDSSGNIISHLLLTGDLKGRVYKPDYYFSNNSDSVAQHLDLVMLTNGWRRFNWQAIAQGKLPEIKYPNDTAYLTFSGKVYGATPAELRGAGDIFAIIQGKDSSKQTVTATIKPDGSFADPDMVLFDSAKIYYQFINSRNLADMSEVRFMTNILPSPKRIVFDKSTMVSLQDTAGLARLQYLASEEARLRELTKGTTLQGVTVTTKAKSPLEKLDEQYASGLFQGSDAYQFDLTNDPLANSYPSVFNYLQGKVAGLQITANGSNTSLSWRGGSPSLYVNEMQADVNQLSTMSMADIAYVKVFRPPFMGGFNGANGAIAIYTRKGGPNQATPGKGLPYKNVIGYTIMKEFYSPNYATIDPRNEAEDVRSTLYWNPMILTTPENHRIVINFFNNDITDAFRVIVEGVSKDGRITHVEKVLE